MSEQKLPMAAGAAAGGPVAGAPAAGVPDAGGAQPPPVQVSPSAVRLVGTLTVAGAVAGLAIVLVFQWAQPRIEAYQARVLAEAVTEVLGGAQRYETVFLENGALTAQPQADTASLDRVYVGYDEADQRRGVAMVHAQSGFQDVVRVIFGYDPGSGNVLGMKVLESKETPGLGDKIEKDSVFVGAFTGTAAPLLGVKADRVTGAAGEVAMITGATISSRVVIDIINNRLNAMKDPVHAYWSSPVGAAAAPSGQGPAAGGPGGGS
jgi:electron transport complex protein RnfG